MNFTLSAISRVLVAFSLATLLSFAAFSTPAYASNTAQLDAATIIALANAGRAANGAPALEEDTLLDRVAQQKANDMAAKGYFAHVSPDGLTPWHWFKQAGYYYYDAGENLAQGFSDVESLNAAWMNSPTHRANIMNPAFTKVGIGIAVGQYQGRQVIFVAQEFARPYVSQPAIAKAPSAPLATKAVSAPVPQTLTAAKTAPKKAVAGQSVSKKKPAAAKAAVQKAAARKTSTKVGSSRSATPVAALPKRTTLAQR